MSLQTWTTTQLYVHSGVFFLYPLHMRIAPPPPIHAHMYMYPLHFNYQFQFVLVWGAYKTYDVPKLPKLDTKTLFVPSLTIVCGPWTTWPTHREV